VTKQLDQFRGYKTLFYNRSFTVLWSTIFVTAPKPECYRLLAVVVGPVGTGHSQGPAATNSVRHTGLGAKPGCPFLRTSGVVAEPAWAGSGWCVGPEFGAQAPDDDPLLSPPSCRSGLGW
jgi:hypothetical protein